METTSTFRIEPMPKRSHIISKEVFKIFKKTKTDLPLDIDVENRFGIFCAESEQYLEELYNFEVRKDDVWVLSMPKSGSTWMTEMVWMLVNNLDYETAMNIDQTGRYHFLEYFAITPLRGLNGDLNIIKSSRILKSHLPMHMLPKGLWTVKPKIVYVTRDPKDVIVSLYHFATKLGYTKASIEDLVNEIVNNEMIFCPFWAHVGEFWSLRNESNVHFTSYERMENDLRLEIIKVSKFLEKTLNKEQLDKLVEHLTFDKMKENQSCNKVKWVGEIQKFHGLEENPMGVFIRKGKVGSYKDDLTNDLIEAMEDWTQKSTKPFGVTPQEILFS